jgi:hypothetical protein
MSLSEIAVYRVVGNLTLEREYQRILPTQSLMTSPTYLPVDIKNFSLTIYLNLTLVQDEKL